MPLTSKGEKVKAAFKKEYGDKEGESNFYAARNKGTISGVDPESSKKKASGFAKLHKKGKK